MKIEAALFAADPHLNSFDSKLHLVENARLVLNVTLASFFSSFE